MFLTPATIAASYHVFLTQLLALFSYCEQTPRLPLSHRDRRMRLFLAGLLSRAYGTVSRGGDPAAIPYLHLPGKQSYWLTSPLKEAGQHHKSPVSQVAAPTTSISRLNAPACPTPCPGRRIFAS